ncbi:hypothetical protein BDL97_16G050100 [Sphagnum fallax]|nr:hypothetical protein BDL97_16G050100 [Sphagnum fallax]
MDINRFIQELIEEDTTRTRSSSGGSNSVNAQIAGNSSVDSNSTPRSDRSVASYNPRGRGRDPPSSVSSNNPRGPPSDSSVDSNNPGVEGSGPSSFVAGSNNSGGGGSICSNNPGLSALSDSSVGSNSPESGDQDIPQAPSRQTTVEVHQAALSVSAQTPLCPATLSGSPRGPHFLASSNRPHSPGSPRPYSRRDFPGFPKWAHFPEPPAAATYIVSLEGPEIKGRFS